MGKKLRLKRSYIEGLDKPIFEFLEIDELGKVETKVYGQIEKSKCGVDIYRVIA